MSQSVPWRHMSYELCETASSSCLCFRDRRIPPEMDPVELDTRTMMLKLSLQLPRTQKQPVRLPSV
jgi:hypothetical protein